MAKIRHSGGLSEKQRRFVEAYMGEAAGNGTKAARLAGYKGANNVLAVIATENLRKPNIIKAIQERVKNDSRVATRKERQEFWTRAMYGQEAGVRDAQSRIKASELLGKSQADFVERRQVELSVTWADLVKQAGEE